MQPAELASLLNHHFERLNDVIEAEGGTVDKYIGDSLMAFWGAPEPAPDHSARACRAALAMAADVASRLITSPAPRLRLKIALHTGPLIVGSIGAPTRMNYTVIGDTVNVCSRIESLAAKFIGDSPVAIIVSDTVRKAAAGAFHFEELGVHPVRGRRQTVSLYRLVSEKAPPVA
jgi:adenylate cyclase